MTLEDIYEKYGQHLTEEQQSKVQQKIMKDKLAQYKQYKEELSAELRKYVQDKNNPLDERFEALCECPELSGFEYSTDFGLDRELFNPDNYGRGTEFLVEDLYGKTNVEEEITFKEYCCDNFISSMIFDW